MKMQRLVFGVLATAWLGTVCAQQADGVLKVNGASGVFQHAAAMEIDSKSSPGYLDVRIVLSDRPLAHDDLASDERLETLVRRDGLTVLRVILNPDAQVMSAMALHPAFTSLVDSSAFIRWEPSAYDEKVAGRFYTDGVQSEFGQRWEYDVKFSAPIELDPKATTVTQ